MTECVFHLSLNRIHITFVVHSPLHERIFVEIEPQLMHRVENLFCDLRIKSFFAGNSGVLDLTGEERAFVEGLFSRLTEEMRKKQAGVFRIRRPAFGRTFDLYFFGKPIPRRHVFRARQRKTPEGVRNHRLYFQKIRRNIIRRPAWPAVFYQQVLPLPHFQRSNGAYHQRIYQ